MTWINSRSYANKFIELLSDNRVLPSEWKYHLPIHIVQQPITVVVNAYNLAQGIEDAISLYHPNIDEYLATDPNSQQFTLF
jgi:hypothetical protein